MEILFILFLTLLNALFAMSELAMSTARKVRLNAMAEAGDKGAAAALKLAEEPTRMLSTVQVGITSIGLLNGIVGEAAFAAGVAAQLQTWGTPEALARPIATFSVVVVLAYITLIFGEMVPKRIGLLYPEAVVSQYLMQQCVLGRRAVTRAHFDADGAIHFGETILDDALIDPAVQATARRRA